MTVPEGTVKAKKEESIGWVIFDNPARLNALSEDMAAQAIDIVREFSADQSVRVVILRGAGHKAFISGGDISKFQHKDEDAGHSAEDRANYDALKALLQDIDKPVLAMIYGYCLGGGMGLALSADVRLAASSARLGIPAAKRALGYPWQHLQALVDIVGPAVAKDVMFSGRQIEADEALRLGLVNRVIETDALERETRAYAAMLAENAPLTMKAAKVCINTVTKGVTTADEVLLDQLVEAANNSEDFKESTRAFLEKRKPVFRGR